MSRTTIFAVFAISATIVATAAAPPAFADGGAPPTWSGFYAGIQLGYGGGQDRVEEVNGPRIYFADTEGVVGGAHVGWQKQFGKRFLGGVEVEGGWLGQQGDATRSDAFATVDTQIDLGAYATLTGRLGVFVSDDWLAFGRFGLTVAELDARTTETATPSGASTQDTTWGYTFGAGVEHKLSANWSIVAEYQYTDFRDELALPDHAGPGPGWDHNVDLHALKVGLNMKF